MKNFAIVGVAGYIAPRHLQAIRETGNRLIAASDPHDSVGILDRYFAGAAYFREFERFDRHLDKLRRENRDEKLDYLAVCSPNYLHDAHIRLALRLGADAICEKPLVLNPWNLDALSELERESGRRVYTVLQLRVHPALVALRDAILTEPTGTMHDVTLSYVTPRGMWYHHSWKGDRDKSGGITTNIGIHLFDLLIWVFGGVRQTTLHVSTPEHAAGYMELERARVRWYLSVEKTDLPQEARDRGLPSFRLLEIDGRAVEFSDGFTDLHTRVYERTLQGDGFGIEDARPAIELAHRLREAAPSPHEGLPHPWLTPDMLTRA